MDQLRDDRGEPARDTTVYVQEVTARATAARPPAAPSGRLPRELERAGSHAVIDSLPDQARFRPLKRLLLRGARLFTHHQVEFNQATLGALQALGSERSDIQLLHDRTELIQRRLTELEGGTRTQFEALKSEVAQGFTRTQANLASAELVAEDSAATSERLEQALGELRLQVFDSGRQAAVDRTEMKTLASLVNMLLSEARSRLPNVPDDALTSRLAGELTAQHADLYTQFEEAFRGSRAEILERQRPYLDYVWGLRGESASVLDIGSGRGEWLDLLRESGIECYGVDTNESFVRMNTERGLDVRLEDGLEHLRGVPDSTLGALTAFHVAEHLDLTALVDLIDQALRSLRPGGRIIFETPNPTNVAVGAGSFYLDPTHIKPLHPQLLEFLVGSRGFVDVEVRFLNPSPEPCFVTPALSDEVSTQALKRVIDHLNWAFFGPQDFAVIGTKAAQPV